MLDIEQLPYKRDKKDCNYQDNLKEFMNAIRNGKKVIVVFSQAYLKSKNCMYELSGIMESENYKNYRLPVVIDDSIRDSYFYVELVKHWKEEKEQQHSIVADFLDTDPDMAGPEQIKEDEIKQIYSLLSLIKNYIDWTNADSLDALSSSHFKKIIDKLAES